MLRRLRFDLCISRFCILLTLLNLQGPSLLHTFQNLPPIPWLIMTNLYQRTICNERHDIPLRLQRFMLADGLRPSDNRSSDLRLQLSQPREHFADILTNSDEMIPGRCLDE
ncbi:uncharacterized protein K489DRAFT_168300 [Dissoconium aciculare CBS 342.82]|uniref:Secreted protein n=1 Tax=Dissoconium aciculare CBS 342.82 TaxID=1314786 RepID=A0A6J3LPB7_9PEZI|nr:uncharacterized protein K489DRAFT_168300 [Dissoconium aciculare CBS 342.82]KAF1817730.1 hypothetical protein K489DRAFT_168300 [Dissoconium aciculare CBS 342.82]